jgi:hypothetical protein
MPLKLNEPYMIADKKDNVFRTVIKETDEGYIISCGLSWSDTSVFELKVSEEGLHIGVSVFESAPDYSIHKMNAVIVDGCFLPNELLNDLLVAISNRKAVNNHSSKVSKNLTDSSSKAAMM